MNKYSLCHASYKSAGRSIQVRNYWLNAAVYPQRIEHLLGYEDGDLLVSHEYGISEGVMSGVSKDGVTRFKCTKASDSSSAVRNWNAAAEIANGDFLFAIADDLVPEKGWDVKLDALVSDIRADTFVLTFTDDRCLTLKMVQNDTLLPRHPLLSRSTYERLGYLFNPKFDSVGPDFDLLILSILNGWLWDARAIKLHHSIGPILDTRGSLICGCEVSHRELKRTEAQTRMHRNSDAAWRQLKSDWGFIQIFLGRAACVNRLANHVYNAINHQEKNSAVELIARTLLNYYSNKLLHPGLRS
jgi:hypothetical protein